MAVICGHPSEAAGREEGDADDNDSAGKAAQLQQRHQITEKFRPSSVTSRLVADGTEHQQHDLETTDDRLNISWSQDPLTTNRRVRQRLRHDGTSKDDCLPDDPAVGDSPGEITDLRVGKGPAEEALLSWTALVSAFGDPSDFHAITSGLVNSLWADRDFGGACAITGTIDPDWPDARVGPPSDDAFYYLVQASAVCGLGSPGASAGGPDARTGLDWSALPACP